MADARILQLCDAVVSLIGTGWDASAVPRSGSDGVQRGYSPTISFTPDAPPQIAGRQVYVFPQPQSAVTDTRSQQMRAYRVRVLVVEQYQPEDETDDKTPPQEWFDERVNFCEQVVFNPLCDPSLLLVTQMFPALEEEATVDVLYDEKYLLENHAFWSLMTFPFQEQTLWAGGVES